MLLNAKCKCLNCPLELCCLCMACFHECQCVVELMLDCSLSTSLPCAFF